MYFSFSPTADKGCPISTLTLQFQCAIGRVKLFNYDLKSKSLNTFFKKGTIEFQNLPETTK